MPLTFDLFHSLQKQVPIPLHSIQLFTSCLSFAYFRKLEVETNGICVGVHLIVHDNPGDLKSLAKLEFAR